MKRLASVHLSGLLKAFVRIVDLFLSQRSSSARSALSLSLQVLLFIFHFGTHAYEQNWRRERDGGERTVAFPHSRSPLTVISGLSELTLNESAVCRSRFISSRLLSLFLQQKQFI